MTKDMVVIQKKTIADYLNNRKDQLARVLPKVGITPERMVQVAFNAFNNTPALLECSPQSLFKSLIQCASLGIEPNTALGHAYLIPFNNKGGKDVQLVIGYKGFLSLARRSGELKSITSHCVYDGDLFEAQFGTVEYLKHVPSGKTTDDKDITHAYAVAHFKDGGFAFEVMTRKQVDEIRGRSKAGSHGPWVTDYAQMCRKTVIRRLMNYLPLSIEIQRAVAVDSQNEAGKKDLSEFTGIIDAEYTVAGEQPEEPKPDAPPVKPAAKKSKLEKMAEKAAPPATVDCPNAGKHVPATDCDGCAVREGCPAH